MDIPQGKKFHAQSGANGGGNNKTGRKGKSCTIKIPVGTLIKDLESQVILKDLSTPGESFTIAKGGKGGKGNSNFKSSTRQAPRKATEGKLGETKQIQLELKLLADCGLVGFPNAGKSSLIRKLSAARPKVGNYPFTTLAPNLGVVKLKTGEDLVLADVPGLIEGAAEGKGLGRRFLKHLERTSCLIFLIDPVSHIPAKEQYRILCHELHSYQPEFSHKDRIIVINKCDLGEFEFELPKTENHPVLRVSAINGNGLPELLEKLDQLVGDEIRKSPTNLW